MNVPISRADDPRIAAYADVARPDRLRASGLFVAEGRLVVRRLIESTRFEVESARVAPAALEGMADAFASAEWPIYVAPPAVVHELTGFNFHRGCLALARRGRSLPVTIFTSARRLLALEAIGNPDNVGGLFRVAAAFGVEGVVLSPGCGDPFYRKSIRTSMGAVLRVPFATTARWPEELELLRVSGFKVVALTPAPPAIPLRDFAGTVAPGSRLLLICGAEGPGLTSEALSAADCRVRIPVAPGIDSLNVVVATGIAMAALAG